MTAALSLVSRDLMAHEEPKATEYTIDELATLTRVPSRTIRFYQSAGALPGPQIRGRVAYYDESHIERLKLIATLQDRGLRMRAIRDLLTNVDKGEVALGEWLGLEKQLEAPWVDDRERLVNEAELKAMLGEMRPGLIADLIRLKVVERRGDRFIVESPALLDVGLKLEAAGIDLETANDAANILRKHMDRAAHELVQHFYKRIGKGFGREVSPSELGAAYEALRPTGFEAVRLIFAREMEHALRKLVESGATTEVSRRTTRAKHEKRESLKDAKKKETK